MTLGKVIADTRRALSGDPATGQVAFSTVSTLTGTTRVDVRTGRHSFTVDEPWSLGGGGEAASPVQYALAALGSCQAITYRFWAELLGIRFDKLTVQVDGDLDLRGFLGVGDGVRPGVQDVRIQVDIAGPEPAERYQELAAAVSEHCPVLDLFENPVPVTCTTLAG